jgi:hypothetical protein
MDGIKLSPFRRDKEPLSPIKQLNLKKSHDFITMVNEKSITTNDSYSLLTEKKLKNNISIVTDKSSIKSSKFITLSNNRRKRLVPIYKNNLEKFPEKSTPQLLTEADALVKERRNHEGFIPTRLTKNAAINKSKEINLKNYIIRRIKENRENIKNNEQKLIEQFKIEQNNYERNYRNYLNVVDENIKKQKEEEKELNILKSDFEKKENLLLREKNENKNLEEKLKRLMSSILIYKKYGVFVHKVFGTNKFKYGELKEFDGKDYYKIMKEFIDIYDHYNGTDVKEENDFMDMLLFQGEEALFRQFKNMENRVINVLEKKNTLDEEIKNEKDDNRNEIKALSNRKKDTEKENVLINLNKINQKALVVDFKDNDIEEIKQYMKYITELGEAVGLLNPPNVETTKLSECLYFCKDTLDELEKKEMYVNSSINYIENIYNMGDNDEKYLIEYIINDRKKYNKKMKLAEIRKIQEEKIILTNKKIIDRANKIYVKGRKVIKDYPINQNKKKKIKIAPKGNNEDLEYLYYSSDEN